MFLVLFFFSREEAVVAVLLLDYCRFIATAEVGPRMQPPSSGGGCALTFDISYETLFLDENPGPHVCLLLLLQER
jgi:hypothetical protein